jgi:hypothetical protein
MTNTHLGIPAADLLLLEGINTQDPNAAAPLDMMVMVRIRPQDGTYTPDNGSAYIAPAGKAMVITEVDWQYKGGTPGSDVALRIFLKWGGFVGMQQRALEDTILLGATGGGGSCKAVTTGFLVPPGVRISPEILDMNATGILQHVILRGYLTDYTAPAETNKDASKQTAAKTVVTPAQKTPAKKATAKKATSIKKKK